MDEFVLRIYIVEDESLTRSGLRDGIDWAGIGCEICGEAADGQEALEHLLECTSLPDVVLTDVEMPRMDGIALLKEIKARQIPVATVVLSGYDEFRYAQNALRCGASEYLLKPLRSGEVLEVFGRLREHISLERRETEMRRSVNSIVRTDSERVLELALSLLLTDQEADISAFFSLLRHYDYSCGGELSLILYEFSDKQQAPQLKALMRGQLLPELAGRCICTDLFDGLAALALCPPEESKGILRKLFDAPENQACIPLVRAVLFPDIGSPELLKAAPPLLRRYKNENFYYSFGRLHEYTESRALTAEPVSAGTLEQRMEQCIRDDQPQTLRAVLREHMNALTAARPPRDLMVIKLTEAYSQTVERLRAGEPGLRVRSFEQLYLELSRCVSRDELAEAFAAMASELYTEYRRLTYGETDVVEQIRRHIDRHYAEALTLASLAESFFLSPNYLSTQFSQKTGRTLSAYLRGVRLLHAKQALVSTRHSIYEIAVSVGYTDYRHFCNIFKKECGVSPLHYRRKNGGFHNQQPWDGTPS